MTALRSTGRLGPSGSTSHQLPENGGNFVEIGGLIQEIVCAGGKAFVAVLLVWVVRANEYLQAGMTPPNRAKHIQTGTPRHLQIKNEGIGIHLLDGDYCVQGITRLPDNLHPCHILQEVSHPLNDNLGVIGNEDLHFLPFLRGTFLHVLEDDKSGRKYIRWKP